METLSRNSASFATAKTAVGVATTPELSSVSGTFPTKRKKQGQPEFELACAIAGLLRRTAKPGVFWTAIENGERRPVVAVERCKRKGVRNGLPDLLCLASGQLIALELKTERNKLRGTRKGVVSPDQKAVKEMIEAAGGVYEVAFGYDHAVKFLTEWGVLRPDQSLVRPSLIREAANV